MKTKINFIYKYIIPIGLSLFFTSCKHVEQCHYPIVQKIIIMDTIIIPSIHHHYVEDSMMRCAYIKSNEYPYIDTIYLDIYIKP